MPFVEVNGVSCYHEVDGEGEPVVVLHGGFCSIETMRPQIEALKRYYRVYAPERPGHGRSRDRGGPFSHEANVADTLAYLDAVEVDSAHVVGFSDGAIAGILLSIGHADRVRSLVAISGNLDPAGLVPEERREHAFPGSAFARLQDDYARLSPDGAEHAQDVLGRMMPMWQSQPHIAYAALAHVAVRTLVMAGDHDVIATAHTVAIFEALPNAELCIVPNSSHMLMLERPDLVNLALEEFLTAARSTTTS
jgi:pimeloyl-ACP methyl ester carboxylesterase